MTVIAGVRDTTSATTLSLRDLPRSTSSQLIIVKTDNTSLTDAQKAVDQLVAEHGITALDVVIANAGIARYDCSSCHTILQASQVLFQTHIYES